MSKISETMDPDEFFSQIRGLTDKEYRDKCTEFIYDLSSIVAYLEGQNEKLSDRLDSVENGEKASLWKCKNPGCGCIFEDHRDNTCPKCYRL